MTLVCPGLSTEIDPPQVHNSLQLLLTIGIEPLSTAGTPGSQGEAVAGTQGIGVRTPSAAAVAEATVGFDGEVHMPNGGTLTMGLKCELLADGTADVSIVVLGMTITLAGATPKVHIIVAPMQTAMPMCPC
jgi:hypothetical protein